MNHLRTSSFPPAGRVRSRENGDPSGRFSNIQVVVDSGRSTPIRDPHIAYVPVEPTRGAANTGLNENIAGSSKNEELYAYAQTYNGWEKAKSIYAELPDMVRIPLTTSGDTALHVAVSANNTNFVKGLLTLMTPEDLEIPNVDGNTAFCMAVITGNGDYFQIMIEKNEKLPIIPGHEGMLPVHLAVLTGYHNFVKDLSSETFLQSMAFEEVKKLFHMTINSSMYDIAMKLLEKYPEQLVVGRYDTEKQTALHMLVQKPPKEYYTRENNDKEASTGMNLFQKLWNQVRQLEYKKILELITDPSVVLFDAVMLGNFEVVKWLLYMNRELLTIKDPKNGRNILHVAALYRQHRIFRFILKMGTANLIIRAVDKDRNNILHFAARHPEKEEASSSLRPNIRMQRELVWFKDVENRSPPELRTMRNRDGKTPKDIFSANHTKLSNEVKEAAKGIGNYGMVVATLIATLAFAAALTVPGDKSSAAFIVFILTNAVALFTSSASIVSFLSIFTSSRFTEKEYIISLHPILILGLSLLFFSIASIIIAFAAASFLIFDGIHKWVAYVVASLGVIPILMFLMLQLNLLDGLLDYFFWSRYYHVSKDH